MTVQEENAFSGRLVFFDANMKGGRGLNLAKKEFNPFTIDDSGRL